MSKQRRGIHLIAELAGVSIGTVDRALHGRDGIKESTRQRILQVTRQIGYTPNLAARALYPCPKPARASAYACRKKSISFTTNCGGAFWKRASVSPRLASSLSTTRYKCSAKGDTDAFKELMKSGVNGIILTAGNPKDLKPLIDDAEEKGIRVVCVSTDAPDSKRSCIVCVEPWLNGCLAGELMGKFVPNRFKGRHCCGHAEDRGSPQEVGRILGSVCRHCHGGKIVGVIEGHEDEDESFQKTFDLLRRFPAVAGIYVNTVNCLPVCRALGARGLAGKVKLIATDLFAEMAPYFQKGTISASIYQQPFRQGQLAVRLMADNLTNKVDFPPSVHLSPGVVMTSNLHLFREMRRSEAKLSESIP